MAISLITPFIPLDTTATDRGHRKRLEDQIALALVLMTGITAELAGGERDSSAWYAGILHTLSDVHTAALALGRSAAHGAAEAAVGATDRLGGSLIAHDEAQFLRGFRGDIENGRYTDSDGALRSAAVDSRLRMYSAKLRATANRAFVEASPEGASFVWNLRDGAHHCAGNGGMNCPEIAAGGTYTRLTMPTYPGGGETPCLTNCRCWLTRILDGAEPFGGQP